MITNGMTGSIQDIELVVIILLPQWFPVMHTGIAYG